MRSPPSDSRLEFLQVTWGDLATRGPLFAAILTSHVTPVVQVDIKKRTENGDLYRLTQQ